MEVKVVGFVPPQVGLEDEFNTFRMGKGMYGKLEVGQQVFLMDEKKKIVFGRAEVTGVEVGKLGEMILLHGDKNHTQLKNPEHAAENLYRVITKIYGPHLVTLDKVFTVLSLKRLE